MSKANPIVRPRHLACSCDGAYLPHLATMLRTLADHNNAADITVHFLSAVDDRHALKKFSRYIRKLNFGINVVNVDRTLFTDYPLHGHVTEASYYRLALPDVLSSEIERVLFLDCDMCINGDLSHLWELDLQGHCIAAVESPDDPEGDRERLGLSREDLYFNAGMMVMDLQKLRLFGLLQQANGFLQNCRDRIKWWDQDVLNALLYDRALPLSCEWNYLPLHGNQASTAHVRVVHFSGGGWRKPWHYNCTSEYKSLYIEARARTPYRRYRLDRAPSLSFRARGAIDRALSRLGLRNTNA